MPKVYILPEMKVSDRYVTKTLEPNMVDSCKKIGGYWSIFEYYLWNYGSLELGESNGITTLLAAKPSYIFKLDGKTLKTPEQLRSFDVEPGEHTLSIDLRLAVDESYNKPGLYEWFVYNEVYTTYTFDREIKFNIESGNSFFVLSLSFDIYYPLLSGQQFIMNKKGYAPDWRSNCLFHENHTKNIKNVSISFQQVDLSEMKARLNRHVKYTPYFKVSRNEPLPTEDGVSHTVKSSIGNNIDSDFENKQVLKTTKEKVSKLQENKPLSVSEKAKLEDKTISQYIMDRQEVVKPRKRIVKKEVIKNVKYFESDSFKDLMQDFNYSVLNNEVVLEKVKFIENEIIIPDGVNVIKEGAFDESVNGVAFVKLPYSVKILEKGAFKNNKSIEKVEILSRIDTIEKETFFGCSNLEEIKIPSYVKKIKSKAFLKTKLEKVCLPIGVKIEDDSFEKDVKIIYGTQKQIDVEKQVYDALVLEALTDKENQEKIMSIQNKAKEEKEKLENDLKQFIIMHESNSSVKKDTLTNSNNKTEGLEKDIEKLKEKIKRIKSKL